MKTPDKKRQTFTKEQRRQQRAAQVRRQKRILAAAGIALFLCAVLLIIRFSSKTEPEILTINEACESYRPQVEEAAALYGMSDYVDLILALMMQESSGQGPDVMQSSEGAYNTRYPQEPNGITDVSYSISCGIQELKYAMEQAGVQSPTDIEHIRLALQGYNFGSNVYFPYMEENGYSVWTEESAEAFAQKASSNTPRSEDDPLRDAAGPWAYGDQRYPEHVLRYYHPEA